MSLLAVKIEQKDISWFCGQSVVYKQAYETSRGGRTISTPRPISRTAVFLRKDARRKTQKIILCQ